VSAPFWTVFSKRAIQEAVLDKLAGQFASLQMIEEVQSRCPDIDRAVIMAILCTAADILRGQDD
jgi:hypothetical protein